MVNKYLIVSNLVLCLLWLSSFATIDSAQIDGYSLNGESGYFSDTISDDFELCFSSDEERIDDTDDSDIYFDGSDEDWVDYTVVNSMIFNSWLSENFRYPNQAASEGMQGSVIVGFTIEKNGTVSNIKLLRSTNYMILDTAAIGMVKRAPKWKPYLHGTDTVRTKMIIPIVFELRN